METVACFEYFRCPDYAKTFGRLPEFNDIRRFPKLLAGGRPEHQPTTDKTTLSGSSSGVPDSESLTLHLRVGDDEKPGRLPPRLHDEGLSDAWIPRVIRDTYERWIPDSM